MISHIYVIQSQSSGKIYIGQTNNIELGLKRHNGLLPHKKSSFTYINKGPWKLMYKEEYPSCSMALKREKQLKNRQGREYLKDLIRNTGA